MMVAMRTVKLRHFLNRLLLAVSYTAVVFEWLWISLIGIPPLIEAGLFDSLFSQTEQPKETVVNPIASSPLVVAIVGITTVVVLVITAIVMIRLPRTIVRNGDAVINHTAEKVIPIVTHHKVIPTKKRRVLSRRLRLILQIAVCVVPFSVLLLLPETVELSRSVVAAVTLFLGGSGAICFIVAWLVEPTQTTSRTRSHASRG